MNGTQSRPLRVLVAAAQEPWPLDHGGRLRLHHFIDHLAGVAEVTLALPGAAAHTAHLSANVRVETMRAPRGGNARRAGADADSLPQRLARRHFGYNARMDLWLQRHANPARFDVALFSGPQLGLHVPAARVPVVWDGVDELVLYAAREAQFGSWRRWPAALRHALLYALYERAAARQATVTVFTSAVDAAWARRWTGGARVEVVTNGVDLEHFRPRPGAAQPGTVVFVGSLEFPPNVDGIVNFTTGVWPRLLARDAARRLLIVGRRPVAAVRALATRPGVELAADVPDVRPYLAQASVVIVPTRQGGGVKNKILEACSMRRPVIATPRALGGLSARIGVEVLSAAGPHAWIASVHRVLSSPSWAERLAAAGHAWVRRAHRWPDVGARLVQILEAARQGQPVRGRCAAGAQATAAADAPSAAAPGAQRGRHAARGRRMRVRPVPEPAAQGVVACK